jgi:glycosyltransferase involved in cell wall biosynthesis
MTIRVLCITEDLDRPTTALFVGLRASGIDIRVVCPDNASGRAVLAGAGVPLLHIPFRRRVDREAIAILRAELAGNRYDILHAFSNKALQNGLIATRGLNVKIVAYRGIVGNVSFWNPISWMRFLNPRIDKIVCVANAVRDYFLQMRPAFLRMPPDRPVTIYKGHSLDWYKAAPANLADIGLPSDAFAVACVANYRPRKGIEYLVEAIALLPESCHAHLLLIGHMDNPGLAKAIERSGARQRIHVLGFRPDAPSLTAACHVFALPSIKREGLARSLIEAMAYGVAPVVTDCGGSPELVVDGQCGIVVPVRSAKAVADALQKLHDDPELRASMGRAARARIADDFRIENTIAQTLALYEDLVRK